MKSAIVYATTKPPIKGREYNRVTKTNQGQLIHIWIRVNIVGGDVATALNLARPRPDEILLNTIPV